MQRKAAGTTVTRIWVQGPEILPAEVVDADVLSQEDIRDLTLDHMARTCEIIFQVEISKWS